MILKRWFFTHYAFPSLQNTIINWYFLGNCPLSYNVLIYQNLSLIFVYQEPNNLKLVHELFVVDYTCTLPILVDKFLIDKIASFNGQKYHFVKVVDP